MGWLSYCHHGVWWGSEFNFSDPKRNTSATFFIAPSWIFSIRSQWQIEQCFRLSIPSNPVIPSSPTVGCSPNSKRSPLSSSLMQSYYKVFWIWVCLWGDPNEICLSLKLCSIPSCTREVSFNPTISSILLREIYSYFSELWIGDCISPPPNMSFLKLLDS